MDRILIDWGTSNARVFRVSDDGRLRDQKEFKMGILHVPAGGFRAAFDSMTAGWRRDGDGVPVLMSGMVGSRQGWAEAPYAACPAGADDLAARIMPVPGHGNIRIVPGVCLHDGAGRRDVIRGEEVQVLGALERAGTGTAVLCLPGTHSKWVSAKDGRITDFATSMTGEVYDLMRKTSILSRLMPENDRFDEAAFMRGLSRAATSGGLLHHLFSVRADALFDDMAGDALPSYLSGMMIGQEIRDMRSMYMDDEGDTALLLVAGSALAGPYQRAFRHMGIRFHRIDAVDATITGLHTVLAASQ